MRRSRHTLPGDPFRLGRIRLSRVLWLSAVVVMLCGLLEPEAAAQTVSFGAKTDFGTGGGPHSVAVGDFNGDGKLDLAVANVGTVSILLGTGTGNFGAKTDFGTGADGENLLYPSSASVAVGDFNGDGKLDLAVANFSGTVSILLGTGTGSFGAKTDFNAGGGDSVAVGDFNGDGKLDLAVANFSGTVSILLGTGTGSFGAKTDFPAGATPSSVAVGDFNGDGKLDLAVGGGPGGVIFDTRNTVSILLGTGTGSFGPKTDFDTGTSPLSVAVDDFNRDGNLDLAVANFESDNTVSILLGTGTGSFVAKTDFGTGRGPYSVVVGDFNGDGKIDLAVANYYGSTVSILLNTSPASCASTNPIDCTDFFIRQHYRDFLNREPDASGLAFWTKDINACGADVQCVEMKRVNDSAAFFLSIEFQQTGYLVYKTYAAAFGPTRIASTVPLTRSEFLPDVQSVAQGVVVLADGWQEQLEANQTAYFNEFVQRPNFVATYPPAMTSAQYVDSLNTNAGGALSSAERDQLVQDLSSGAKTRAQVLRAVAENEEFTRAHFNRAFVLMQYFGYLRRNPNDAPDNNFDGYNFWLTKLDQFNGNFIEAEMVKAFIASTEYRQRFGP